MRKSCDIDNDNYLIAEYFINVGIFVRFVGDVSTHLWYLIAGGSGGSIAKLHTPLHQQISQGDAMYVLNEENDNPAL